MKPFDHYMYVLQCGDGSLYTGYTTDVAARVAAHQAGTGAKYTKAHPPVQLVAQARFYSKGRAMSAEARFKQLDRAHKKALLEQAENVPLEDVLRAGLPGFDTDSSPEFVCRSLAAHVDPSYRDFNSRLIPAVDAGKIVGVRTPVLRRIAKELTARDDAAVFLRALPHRLFEENQIHAFAIGMEHDYAHALELYERFLPFVDNWATCDQLPTTVFNNHPEETLTHVGQWLGSGHCYTIRFGIGVLMKKFLDERFERRFCEWVAQSRMPSSEDAPVSNADIYYVDMMRAWYFAEALAKQEDTALPYMESRGIDALLDEWTRRKAIQKAIESRRISAQMKAHLRTLR